jgi:hypothetical protein
MIVLESLLQLHLPSILLLLYESWCNNYHLKSSYLPFSVSDHISKGYFEYPLERKMPRGLLVFDFSLEVDAVSYS